MCIQITNQNVKQNIQNIVVLAHLGVYSRFIIEHNIIESKNAVATSQQMAVGLLTSL